MVKLYSRESCAPCRTLKYWLSKKGIEYVELEPTSEIYIVPTIEIDGQIVEGLNWPALTRLLIEK